MWRGPGPEYNYDEGAAPDNYDEGAAPMRG